MVGPWRAALAGAAGAVGAGGLLYAVIISTGRWPPLAPCAPSLQGGGGGLRLGQADAASSMLPNASKPGMTTVAQRGKAPAGAERPGPRPAPAPIGGGAAAAAEEAAPVAAGDVGGAGLPRLPLIPYPASVTLRGSSGAPYLAVTSSVQVRLEGGVLETHPAVKSLRRLLQGLPAAPAPDRQAGAAGAAAAAAEELLLALDPSAAGGAAEGYVLEVEGAAVRVAAPRPAGLFYAVQTLRQLIHRGGDTAQRGIPPVTIEDAPRAAWRGLMLDVSRHFFAAEGVKRLLDVMALFKLNRFHWHLTDDHGWRLPIKGYEELTKKGATSRGVTSAYTEEEVRDVVQHASQLHIEVLPEIDVPGHAAAAIAAYPELGNDDMPLWMPPKGPLQKYGPGEFTLSPTEATMKFLKTTFAVVAEIFPYHLVHVGGDEVPRSQWSRSPRVLKLLEESGAADPQAALKKGSMQAYFTRKLGEILREQNRSIICWDESFWVGGLPDDAVVMAWRHKAVALAPSLQAGRQVVNANGSILYFDFYQGPKEKEPLAIGGFAPLDAVYGYDPLPEVEGSAEQKRLLLGGQGQLWSEYISTWKHMEYMAFPRSLALAERLWTPNTALRGFRDFEARLKTRLQDLDALGVNYRKLQPQAAPRVVRAKR